MINLNVVHSIYTQGLQFSFYIIFCICLNTRIQVTLSFLLKYLFKYYPINSCKFSYTFRICNNNKASFVPDTKIKDGKSVTYPFRLSLHYIILVSQEKNQNNCLLSI